MILSAVKAIARNVLPEPAMQKLRWSRARLNALRAGFGAGMTARRHGLPGQLVVSLTSYPPRFATLHLTLRSLLRQTIMADRTIIWIAYDDLQLLTPKLHAFEAAGLTIRGCDDVRSYKKLVFALDEFPGAFIVTADDDVFYPPTWLEQLVSAFDPYEPSINCMRAHRLRMCSNGRIAPYVQWEWEVADAAARIPTTDVMPTGNGGILYPPGSLHADATNRQLFEELAPTADDLWFYWMGRRAGSRFKVASRSFKLIAFPYAAEETLASDNIRGGNDRQIRALEEKFGNPLEL